VAYLERAKGEGPGGLSPPVGSRGKAPVGVTECLNFDVLEKKLVKQPKIPS